MSKILVLGDSHIKVFKFCNKQQDKFKFKVVSVLGATAQGSVNPNNKTHSLKIFKKKLQSIKTKRFNYVMVMLGEVDCGFVIWFRSKKYNISVDEQIHNSVNNLFKFIDNVVKKYFKTEQIIIVGCILPTIKDNTDRRFLKGARSQVDVSQEDRTNKTLEYNLLLKNKANELNYKYVDITSDIMGENNIINNNYLNDDPYDHHLDNKKTYKLWLKSLNNVIM